MVTPKERKTKIEPIADNKIQEKFVLAEINFF